MIPRDRQRIAILLALALVALVLLAAGISSLEFSSGRQLPRWSGGAQAAVQGTSGLALVIDLLLRVLAFLVPVLLPIAIVYLILSADARRAVLRSLGLLMWLVAIYLVLRSRPDFFRGLLPQEATPSPPGALATPVPDFVPNAPMWAGVLAAVGLALALAGGLVAAAWYVWRRRRTPASPLDELAEEAQRAVDALRAGAGVQDTVLRCYFEMSRVLAAHRGLARGEAMTPREFEERLVEAGLPRTHVQALTRLFEAVRYSGRGATQAEGAQAIASLSAIARAAREAGGAAGNPPATRATGEEAA
ncbi:MAG: DUF4129 domain-containing protein [Anaerolineae bacterium]|jgi:hypothetical protein